MLIVSQNRKEVVNFNEVVNIWIGYDEIEKKYEINVTGVGYADGTLGYYETEERAKEVLQEIIEKYESQNCIIYNARVKQNAIYEMPDK